MIKIGTKFFYSEETKQSGLFDEVIEYKADIYLYRIKFTDPNGQVDFYVEREEYIRDKMEKFGYKRSWEVAFAYPKKGS